MKKKILVVVDMQNDFITGSLGSEYAEKVVLPRVTEKVIKHGDYVVFTMDTHWKNSTLGINYLNTFEGKNLPVEHCIVGTEGYDVAQPLKNWYVSTGWKHKELVHKETFGSVDLLPKTIKKFIGKTSHEDVEIEIVGLCTDICVVSNALILRAKFPNIKITCDASCCGGTSWPAHDAALRVMKSCQIDVINEDTEE